METQKHPMIQNLAMATGITLIVGILFPIVMPGFGILFPELRMLTIDGVGFLTKVGLLFPLIGAVLVLVGQAQPKYMTRAIFYFIAGFLPVLLNIAAANEYDREFGGGGLGSISGLFSVGFFSYILGLGLLSMVSAAIAGGINRQSPLVGYAALAGGGLTALAMIFPMSMGGETSVLLILPFQVMGHSFFMGLVMLVFVGGLITAAIFSILWGVNQKNGVNHSNLVKYIVLGTFALSFVMIFLAGIFELFDRGPFFTGLIALLTAMIHYLAAMFGGFMAKCLGIIEMLTFTPMGATATNSPSATDKFV